MYPLVLIYNFNSTKQLRMELLCASLGIRMRIVKPAEYQLPVELLIQQPSATGNITTKNIGEMMLICHMNNEMLDTLLQKMRENNITVPLKAVITDTNKHWSSIELYQHLCDHIK